MGSTSLAASRRAAERHARTVAGGPPRSARWTAPAAVVSALGAVVALPLMRPAALALTAVSVLLLAVHRGDRRNAWRFTPVPVAPARFLPPLRPVEQAPPVIDLGAPSDPPALVIAAVHVPTQAVPLPGIPKSRVPVEQATPGTEPQPTGAARRPAPAVRSRP